MSKAKDDGQADGATSAAKLLADDVNSQGEKVEADPSAVPNAGDNSDEIAVQVQNITAPGEAEPFTSDQDAANGAPTEAGLTNEQITLRRTSGDDWPLDGRYRRVFNVEVPRSSTGTLELDWSSDEHQSMHNANCVAVLQEALNKGLHPRGEATFDGPQGGVQVDPFRNSGTEALVYSVEVVPASSELPEEAALAYTPSAALVELGGNTLAEG